MAKRKLSEEDEQFLVIEYKYSHRTQHELADLYGVSRTTIRRTLAKHGLCIYTHPT